jgi:hypothetical protein
VGAEHDQARVVVVGELDDCLPAGRRFGCHARRPEAGDGVLWIGLGLAVGGAAIAVGL